MPHILTVNPRRRRRHRASARRTRRSRAGRFTSRRRRLANPRRSRARSSYRSRRRRNPRGISLPSVRGLTGAIIPAGTGAVGAILLDVGLAYLPLPDQLRTGWGRTAARIAAALGLGFLARGIIGTRNAQLFSAGALTVIAYDVLRGFAADAIGDKVQGLNGLADFHDYSTMGAYMAPRGLPAPNGGNGRLGAYMSPAPILRTRQLSQMGAFGYAGDDF